MKIPILGTFDQYSESKKKPVPAASSGGGNKVSGQIPTGSSIVQYMAPAPTGKNDAGKGKDAQMSGK